MAFLNQKASEIYSYILDSRDPRTTGWLFSRPADILGILALYLVFCLYVGPRYMKNKSPYKMENIIGIYNVLQVILNAYIFHESSVVLYIENFNFKCQAVDFSVNDLSLRTTMGAWWYNTSKLMDLCDTCFFILRKKTSQVTFLHIYHHTLMALFSWIAAFYQPGGNPVVMCNLNSLVHVFMYSYYFITSLGPKYEHFTWWKKHLTQLQIIQFVIIAGHAFPILFRECEYPTWLTAFTFLNALFFIYLFGKFYLRAYIRSSKSNKKS